MMLAFLVGSAQIIIRNIHSILGKVKWVKPQGFLSFACNVLTSRLNVSMEFQFLLEPLGMVWVSLRSTLRYLQSGLTNSARYS